MSGKSLWQRVRRIWVTVGLSVTVVFVGWCFFAYRATGEAREAATTDARVSVLDVDGVIRFSSTAANAKVPVGLLFFPGSLVETVAYAPLCRALAIAGYPVILVSLPRRGAFGGADAPELMSTALGAMHEDERAERWIVGGHSRGAVVAIKLAYNLSVLGANSVAGLLLVGTTHPRDVDLSKYAYPVTKIVGTNDGIAPLDKAEANRHLLPPTTTWVRVEGGNHSQFGWYGFQPLDHFASISRAEQQQQMISATIDALRAAGESSQMPTAQRH